MIPVNEAEHIIYSTLFSPQIVEIPIAASVNRILAQDVYADRDFPPFDRVAMDGIAFNWSDWNGESISVEGLQAAGEAQKQLVSGKAMEVMTGAVLPLGATTVVRYEDVELVNGEASINADVIDRKNIHWQGSDKHKNDLVLKRNIKINEAVIGILATIGMGMVPVYEMPSVCIISTGDELVDINISPSPHQIRKSNAYTLKALCQNLGLRPEMVHLNDDKATLTTKLSEVLSTYDILLLSGGVSKGKFDFVPEVLSDLDVQKHFHRVAQRPGKPFWFGSSARNIVFAFPGNPVSTLVCAVRYFVPWLYKSLHLELKPITARLGEDYTFKPNLTNFLQVTISFNHGKVIAHPVPGNGSGDLANLGQIDGFLELNAEIETHTKETAYTYWPI